MSKGQETRDRIVDRAWRLASRDGLGGLTIGTLSSELGMSKSGLFAHFGSKEELQLAVLRAAMARFEETVVRSALHAPRGEPRLRKLFANWLAWENDPGMPGGCVMTAAAAELDDHPGPARDLLVASRKQWLATLSKAIRLSVEAGHLKPGTDAEQLTYEILGIALAYHHHRRLLRDARAEARAHAAFERLMGTVRTGAA